MGHPLWGTQSRRAKSIGVSGVVRAPHREVLPPRSRKRDLSRSKYGTPVRSPAASACVASSKVRPPLSRIATLSALPESFRTIAIAAAPPPTMQRSASMREPSGSVRMSMIMRGGLSSRAPEATPVGTALCRGARSAGAKLVAPALDCLRGKLDACLEGLRDHGRELLHVLPSHGRDVEILAHCARAVVDLHDDRAMPLLHRANSRVQ